MLWLDTNILQFYMTHSKLWEHNTLKKYSVSRWTIKQGAVFIGLQSIEEGAMKFYIKLLFY